jgi:bacteriocin-like protein
MSDDPAVKQQNEIDPKQSTGQPISDKELDKISGGWGDIKGGSTDDKHKDLSEVSGYTHKLT